jgi:DNA-binding transcriptional ArsR family regulator
MMRPDEVFTALADPTRREIVDALAERGSSTATQLAATMPITRQAVAKHLTHLHRAELVVAERRGRETRYSLTTGPLGEAISWLDDVCVRVSAADAA